MADGTERGASPGGGYPHAADLLRRWSGTDVVVVGDVMLDEWRFTDSRRLSREAPAPVVTLRERADSPGGAGNAAVNLAALGARPLLVAPVGGDQAGGDQAGVRLRRRLTETGVTDRTVEIPGHATPVKRRLLAGDQILLREDEGGPVGDAASRMITAMRYAVEPLRRPALCICDYGLGALDEQVREWLARHRDRFSTIALDAHDLRPWRGFGPTLVTPSYGEAAAVWGVPADAGERAGTAHDRLGDLLELTGADLAAVTLDGDGAVVADRYGRRHRSYSDPAPASHAVGAGDAYLAAFTLAVDAGALLSTASRVAQLAATSTVSGTGTCVCDRDALAAALVPPGPDAVGKLVDADRLARIVAERRRHGARVVFTNGCFDVLHRGHVGYLEQGRRLGDLLVVAVNSDESVRRLKGPNRPVNQVADRAAVLAALACVDHVVVFEADSPVELIEAVRPDVYVKGGDYPPDMVPEAPLVRRLGGEVRTLGYLPDRSTSAIIDRIRARRTSQPAAGS